ncbi:hypothetical protein J2S58_002792 [Nakamurella flavida]|nr:hypothetical protein [Nakamurella flavida]MDP9779169.1 hypothetical protein [Nakamurella flavida]
MTPITSTRTLDSAVTDPAPAVVAHDLSCDPGCPFCLGPETD